MTRRPLSQTELDDIETKLSTVLKGMDNGDEAVDIDAEFQDILAAGQSDAAVDELREMSRRFGPRLIQMLGLPAAPGACRVRFVDNGLQALVDIDPPASDGRPVTQMDVLQQIVAQKITFGLDESEIVRAVELGKSQEVRGHCVARGIASQPGRDASIEPIAVGESTTQSSLTLVAKDQKIARLLPPTPGSPGKDVFGWEIPAVAGKPLVPQAGVNVLFDANENLFYAKSPGRLVIDGAVVGVENMMTYKQDIDLSVGPVNFPGELMIHGWVRSGMTVQADKDIVIQGGVEAAVVRSKDGSVFISKGVQGSRSGMIQAGWDVTAKFVESAAIMAGGVIRTQSAINAELAGGEAVIVTQGKGVVIGGKIYAGERVEVKELGAGSGEPTTVQLGITPENLTELTRVKSRLHAARQAVADAEQTLARYGLGGDALNPDSMTDEGRQMLKLAKAVLVLHSRCRKIEAEEQKFIGAMKSRAGGEVDVRGRVHPGVKIMIGHATYQVKEPLSWVRFKYDADKRRIKVVGL